jgi:nitrite reductase/ring-hydroxylating ferredoxin subunit
MGETTRRSVLAGAAGAGAVAALAACGSGGGGGSSSGGSGSSSGGSGDQPGSSTPATGASIGGAPTTLGKTSDIPVGGGKIFAAEKVVITQPTAGDFKAFSAVCTHQGCIVATVRDNTITCTCHGSQYSATDGSVKRAAPGLTTDSQKPLAAETVKVEGGDNLVLG